MPNKRNETKKLSPVLAIFLCLILLIIGFAVGFLIRHFTTETESDKPIKVVADGDLSIHFMELGNNYTGDSVYIKAGDNDILIDAGSRKGSASTISGYIDEYCTDGVLEYVIATHAHQDHIAGFVGTAKEGGIFDKYECEKIIEFSLTNTNSQIYQDYCAKRDAEVKAGSTCWTALDCINGTKGAQKEFDISGDGSVTMEILYQEFYENKSSDENNYSVCLLIKQGDNNYLFTGDLEKEGEESLVKENNLPEVVLFKAGHHGSKTSSNDILLSVIKPQYVCVCCCGGSVEYTSNLNNTFPTQDFINRIAPYTDNVFVTSKVDIIQSKNDDGSLKYDKNGNAVYEDLPATLSPLNGNIVFGCTNGKISLTCSHVNTKLKDTEWFLKNRLTPDAWKEAG